MSPDHTRRGRLRAISSAAGGLLALGALREALKRHRTPPPPPPEGSEDVSEREVPANRRAETVVALLLVLAAFCGFGFTAAYVAAWHHNWLLGLTIGTCLALLAVAFVIAGKLVVPQEIAAEDRGLLLKEEEAEEVADIVEEGGEGISRRKLLTGAAGLAGAGLLTAAATPLASLGPNLDGIHSTPWRRGARLVVVRLAARYLDLPAARRSWAPEGILAYSKICPHAGCAISLYRYPTYQATSVGPAFTCPCHYSTFLPGEGGRVVFGPAGRALPQLPLMIDGEGHVRAAGEFREDIGPSWWSVHRGDS